MLGRPAVWILVLNYCSLDDTLACVASIRQIDYPNLRLLVMDNASPDGSGAELGRALPASDFVQLPRNTGYAGGNNVGIKLALEQGTDFVFIVNPDVRLPPDCIDTYLDIFSRDDTIGAINSIQVEADGCTIDGNFLTGLLVPLGFRDKSLVPDNYPEVIFADTLFGAALMLSAEALKRVGGFDPLYFAYNEEVDLCRRLRYHGFNLAITPRSPVRHLRTKYQQELSDFVLFLKLKGFYLGQIKDPNKPFLRGIRTTCRDLYRALTRRKPRHYPFDRHPITWRHVLRTAFWFLMHAHLAWQHRKMEISGRAHI